MVLNAMKSTRYNGKGEVAEGSVLRKVEIALQETRGVEHSI